MIEKEQDMPVSAPVTVVLVGRPNVGKSRLFNRLIGHKKSIVADYPGLTRDYQESLCQKPYGYIRILDTPGRWGGKGTSLEQRMDAQTMKAMAQADHVFWVVDQREGLTPADQDFAMWIRDYFRVYGTKPVLMLANKAERSPQDRDWIVGPWGEALCISAEHGQGIEQIYDYWNRFCPPALEDEEDEASQDQHDIRVAILGCPNAGKSTLLNALLGEDRVLTGPERGLTRDAIEVTQKHSSQTITWIDTAGQRKKARVTDHIESMACDEARRALQYAHVGVVVIDIENLEDKQPMLLAQQVVEEGRILVVALNKWDQISTKAAQDQSIYGWRGAEVDHILRFQKDYPQARIIRLEQNYRSTTHILQAANALIAHNTQRMGKALWSPLQTHDRVQVSQLYDSLEEAQFIVDQAQRFHRHGIPFSEIAILVRASFQTRAFEERLMTLGLPYRVVGGTRFYDRAEIRDALAYLRVIHQPEDGLAYERILNTPKRGLGATTLKTLQDYAAEHHIPLSIAAENMVKACIFKAKAHATLNKLTEQFQSWRHHARTESPTSLAQRVLNESGYMEMWKAQKTDDSQTRLENLREFIRALESYETLQTFLEHITLMTEQDQAYQEDRLQLMTLHMAKGSEFTCVFLPGWEDGLFPHSRCIDAGHAAIEEERRLAYVGLTRAKRYATITYVQRRRMYHEWISTIPSRFINELPEEHIISK